MRICERNSTADTMVSEGGEGVGASDTGVEIPLQPVVKTMVRQAVPLQPMKVHGGGGGCLKEAVTPWEKPVVEQVPGWTCGPTKKEAHTRAGLLAGLVTPWGTHAGAVCEGLQPVGRIHIGAVHGGLSPVGGTSHGSGGRV